MDEVKALEQSIKEMELNLELLKAKLEIQKIMDDNAELRRMIALYAERSHPMDVNEQT